MMKQGLTQHNIKPLCRKLFLSLLLLILGFKDPSFIFAADTPNVKPASQLAMSLPVGKSKVHKINGNIIRVSVGDPLIADVMIVNKHEIYLLGKNENI